MTARPDASLGKKLLDSGFDRTLRYSDSRRNLFIGETLEYSGEHLLFAFGEWASSIVLWGSDLSPEGSLQLRLVQPYLTIYDATDPLYEQRGRVTFQKNPGYTRADQFHNRCSIDSCSHDQKLALESLCLCQAHKFPGIVLAEIEVEQYHVNGLLLQDLQSFFNRSAMSNNVESGFRSEKPTYAFPEQGVIV